VTVRVGLEFRVWRLNSFLARSLLSLGTEYEWDAVNIAVIKIGEVRVGKVSKIVIKMEPRTNGVGDVTDPVRDVGCEQQVEPVSGLQSLNIASTHNRQQRATTYRK
jgi:hypothetical protein